MTTDSGIVVVDKPAGWTSHQVVGRLRRVLGTKKVGHAGTLDPMATGVLVAGVNRATRLLGHLALHDKRYLATIRLGAATTTDDAEGEVVTTTDASGLDESAILQAIQPFRGDILQVPSSVSAIKVDGQRAYARVRAGETVELKSRPVIVTRYDVTAVRRESGFIDLDVDVECTSGTYIRALARDLGDALGVGGHLTMLRRTRVGAFTLDHTGGIDITADDASPALLSMSEAASLCFSTVVADAAIAQRVGYGQTVPLVVPSDPTAVLDEAGDLLALYRPDGDHARPVTVLVG